MLMVEMVSDMKVPINNRVNNLKARSRRLNFISPIIDEYSIIAR